MKREILINRRNIEKNLLNIINKQSEEGFLLHTISDTPPNDYLSSVKIKNKERIKMIEWFIDAAHRHKDILPDTNIRLVFKKAVKTE
jgi:hypothetical protein